MSELRRNPLLGTWTMAASNRQNRPNMPKDYCPFCPASGRVPPQFDVLKFDNDFPVLSPDAEEVSAPGFYEAAQAFGKCEVILYSPEHHQSLYQLSVPHIRKLVDLWCERVVELSKDPHVKYIMPFENRGEEVGVTMPHPHGQIYAYPFVPLKLEVELKNSREFYEQKGKCLFCAVQEEELSGGRRIIAENGSFTAFIPYFTDYPYGVFITSKKHLGGLADLTDAERTGLASILKTVTGAFETLFDRPFPYMMVLHQNPVLKGEWKDAQKFFHFHIEFYPPLRAKDKIKYYASSEMGGWAAANVVLVENSAWELKAAALKFTAQTDRPALLPMLSEEFIRNYGGNVSDIQIYSAPSRVNIIGEHIDYNGGWVLPAALDMRFYIVIRKRKDKKISFRSVGTEGLFEAESLESIIQKPGLFWTHYPIGVLKEMEADGHKIDAGMDVLCFSHIPQGSGVSSSAAFEVAFSFAVSEIYGFQYTGKEIAKLSQRTENHYVGVQCGIMDQFASAMGKENHAILLDCATLNYEYVPLSLKGYKIILINTNKKHQLNESRYNERRSECREGLSDIQKKMQVKDLCSIKIEDLDTTLSLVQRDIVKKRVRHVITENARVTDCIKELKSGHIEKAGAFLKKSHESLRDDYEVTGTELDALYESANGFSGCAGARMTGGGFGGCAVAIVKEENEEEFTSFVGKGYLEKTGLTASFYACRTDGGVKKEANPGI